MNIHNFESLKDKELRIYEIIQRYPLDSILIGIRQSEDKYLPFVRAGIALFAIRFCTPGPKIERINKINPAHLDNIADLVTKYLITDPITFDQGINEEFLSSNPVFSFLRLVGHQFPFNLSMFGQHCQSLMLYKKIPENIDTLKKYKFDLKSAFENINGYSIRDFLNVCLLIYFIAFKNYGFTHEYFNKLQSHGVNIPEESIVSKIFNSIAGDPQKLRKIYSKFMNENRKYAMYDFNPLFVYPIVRPWQHNDHVPHSKDRMIAPLPNLIPYRMSFGIFYQLFNEYGTDFSDYFGYIFEKYVGWILKKSFPLEDIISEEDIRKTYTEKMGPVPDWIVLDKYNAIFIECKATRFSRVALVTGKEKYVLDSLKQLIKGLSQLYKFNKNCIIKHPCLHFLHNCRSTKAILITFEPLHLINTPLFRDYINNKLAEDGIMDFNWLILSVNNLETLQPHIAYGCNISEVIDFLNKDPIDKVLDELFSITGKTYKDSCLYEIDKEIYSQIGI